MFFPFIYNNLKSSSTDFLYRNRSDSLAIYDRT
ncbi:hypothetical protein CP061683_1389A, partial [Chlamydia psittaci 06-1683]